MKNYIFDKLFLFVFYLFFALSYFDNHFFYNFKFIGIILISIFYVFDIAKNNKIALIKSKEQIVILVLTFFLIFMLGIELYISNHGFVSIEKYLSIIILFTISFFILPYFILKIGIVKNNYLICISLLIAILLSFFIRPDFTNFIINGRFRMKAYFIHPNTLGNLTFVGILFTLYNGIYNKNKSSSIFTKLLFIIFIGIMILSGSRTSIYSSIIFLLLIFYFNIFKQSNKQNKYLLSSLLIFFFVIFIALLMNTFNINMLNKITSNRVKLSIEALKYLVGNNSLFFGLGSFMNTLGSIYNYTTLDNSYVMILYQNGTLGLTSVIIFLLSLIYLIIKYKKYSILNKNYIIAFYITFLIYCSFEGYILTLGNLYTVLFYAYIWVYFIDGSKAKNFL
ncbi:O-antigen ligase [Thermoanaerobacterium thermosaccharolyticum]|uniref:O-antigen polymerase n=1 Tax=Thermoanaerobacterium thermosaccharolyticum TaxID=1517 RepID=UPI00279D2EAC|nr:O-antigen ligase [Thermoanaerobacterium thermosaccharolyticum]